MIEQLGHRLPLGARATLGAMDGSVTSGVRLQLQIAPEDATHFVVSAGGNDALHHASLIGDKVSSVGEAMEKLAAVRELLRAGLRDHARRRGRRGVPVAVCTIYDARFPDAKQRRLAALGLTIFNDCITREAAARGLALIDLRLILTADGDLANPIEPSAPAAPRSPAPSPHLPPIMILPRAAARSSPGPAPRLEGITA